VDPLNKKDPLTGCTVRGSVLQQYAETPLPGSNSQCVVARSSVSILSKVCWRIAKVTSLKCSPLLRSELKRARSTITA
jgi:hypothetical protein